MAVLKIGNRMVGDGYPAYIIAEMSANHAGSLDRAIEIIHKAKECGADCIKLQTYTPDTLTINCTNEYFRVENGTWEGENLYGLYGKAYTPWEWHKCLKEEAEKVGIDFLSTPFDNTAVDFLEELGLDFYKIASFEMVDIPLLKYVASKGKPIIMSTGMSTLEEIREAVEAVRSCGNEQLALLKCSSAYPAIPQEMHLSTIADMKRRFQLPIGLSDHSLGSFSAVTAVASGANIIEKHFCLGREIENPDVSFSMTPDEFRTMVDEVRKTEAAMGDVFYGVSKQEESSVVFRRSVFVVKDIRAGEKFTPENTRIIRPGYGEKPKYFPEIMQMTANRDIRTGTPFSFEFAQKGAILLLSNNENSRELESWLREREKRPVIRVENKITAEMTESLDPFFIISYNYRFIVDQDIISHMDGRIINLHTSYLPFNRGSAPNFFSFLENTRKGVTIHRLTKELDRGEILCRKELFFDEEKETFETTYRKLQSEIVKLFRENWDDIREGRLTARKQEPGGTYHTVSQLNRIRQEHPFTWNECIAEVKKRIGQ